MLNNRLKNCLKNLPPYYRRGTVDESSSPEPECICERKIEVYRCVNCSNFFKGRLMQKCPEHSDVTFLMDARVCPYCYAPLSCMKLSTESEMKQKLAKDNQTPSGDS